MFKQFFSQVFEILVVGGTGGRPKTLSGGGVFEKTQFFGGRLQKTPPYAPNKITPGSWGLYQNIFDIEILF